jgi:hypothetical protein
MDREASIDRVRAAMESDFLPEPSPDTLSQVDRRMAHAAEYVAYRLGQIDNKLGHLVALLEAFVGESKPSPGPPRTPAHRPAAEPLRQPFAARRANPTWSARSGAVDGPFAAE